MQIRFIMLIVLWICILLSCKSSDDVHRTDAAKSIEKTDSFRLTLEIHYAGLAKLQDGEDRRRVLLSCDSSLVNGFDLDDSLYCLFETDSTHNLVLNSCVRILPESLKAGYALRGRLLGITRKSAMARISFFFSPIQVSSGDNSETEYKAGTTWLVDCFFTSNSAHELEFVRYDHIREIAQDPLFYK